MSYSALLAHRIATATSLRATPVGGFDPRERSDTPSLFVVTDPDSLAAFIRPSFLRWEEEGADARLQDGSRLEAWLVAHGWRA
jgi:hypothetical protein